MGKKAKSIIKILIVILILMVIVLIKFISSEKNNISNKISKLEQSFDLSNSIFYLNEDNYPDNPFDVLSIYLEGYKLIYSDFINNKDVISVILEKQRLLLGDSILNKNSLSSQEEALFESLEYLINSNFKIEDIQIGEPYFISEDNDKVAIKVTKTSSSGDIYNFKYYLQKDSNELWKIVYWEDDNLNYLITN